MDISLLGLPPPCLCVHVSLLLCLSFCFSLTLSSTLWGSSFQLWEVKDQPIRQLACLCDTGHLGLGLAGGGWSFALASRWPATCSVRILVPFAHPPQYVSLSFLTVFSLDYSTPGVPDTDRMLCVCVCVCVCVGSLGNDRWDSTTQVHGACLPAFQGAGQAGRQDEVDGQSVSQPQRCCISSRSPAHIPMVTGLGKAGGGGIAMAPAWPRAQLAWCWHTATLSSHWTDLCQAGLLPGIEWLVESGRRQAAQGQFWGEA